MRISKFVPALFLLASVVAKSQTDSTKTDTSSTKVETTFSTSLDILEEMSATENVSGLLQSSNDVFTNIAGYNFSAARFRVRGYDSENYTVMMNGITLNNPENGRAIWGFWGGLNDITRYQNSKSGISASNLTFGNIGGYSNINARASAIRKGTKISYAASNRTYTSRFMVTHATGMMENGLAIAVSASGRYSTEGYVEGTFYRGASYFISIEKKINDKHSFGFVAYGAPTIQGRRSISTQETYDLTGNNFYNSYWGYQDGKKRNSRVRNTHKPRLMLNHYFKLNDKTNINSSIYYSFGRGGSTRLNWYNANDPRPDYYKNLPSYYNAPNVSAEFQQLTTLWENNDPSTTQLNFDQMYFANKKNLYTVNDAEGVTGKSVTGNRAKYIIEEARQDLSDYGLNSTFTHKENDNLTFSGGVNIDIYKSKNFKVMNDLLGADFWVDIDQYAERDFSDPTTALSDINHPNHLVKVGDKFGYNYDININTYNAFAQAEGTSAKIDWFFGASVSNTSYWRTGHMQNGLFPNNSLGNSKKQSFFNYGVKAGAVYKITGRHLLRLNGTYLTKAPYSRTAYVSPRTRDQVVPNLKNETVMSGDFSYIVRYPKIKTRATVFYTTIKDKTWSRSFYHDALNTYVNYMMTGVDQLFMGMEFGAEINITPTLVANGAFTKGDYIYNSRPTATIIQDNSTTALAENKTIYFKNYKIGGIPQTAASIGLKYNSPKYWYAGANFNYFTDIYLEANPDRRSAETVSKYVSTDPQVAEVLDQTKLNDNYTLDVYIGKSWRLKHKYYIRVNINVNNALNNTDFQTGGFEQLRYDKNNISKFPPKIGYMYGRTYFAMVSFSF